MATNPPDVSQLGTTLDGVPDQQLSATLDGMQGGQGPARPQVQAPQQQPDQLEQLKQQAIQQYQQAGQAPKIKQLLSNYFGAVYSQLTHQPTPQVQQQRALNQVLAVQNAQTNEQYRQAMASQWDQVPMPLYDNDGNIVGYTQVPRKSQGQILQQQIRNQGNANVANIKGDQGFAEIPPELAAQIPELNGMGGQRLPKSLLDLVTKTHVARINAENKSPTEIGLEQRADQGDAQAARILKSIQDKKLQQATARGEGFAYGRAKYTPFETVISGTNIPTVISNLQAIQSGAPKVPTTAAGKYGGQYALYNDAYGLLDKIDALTQPHTPGQPPLVNLDDKTVASRVAAGYAALKEPSSKGLTGEILSNIFARQPIYNTLDPDERELVLAMAQGKAAGTGLRSILGQAGTNEMQQRLDSALMPGGQAVGSSKSVKQQTDAMRGLLDRFAVGQPAIGLNAPGAPTSLANRNRTPQHSGNEPPRPAAVPPGYVFKANGPKGAGWYKP